MPTQEEERLSALERSTAVLSATISDITHNETMLLGMLVKQEEIIRDVKASLSAFNEHLVTFEQSVNSRFDAQEKRFDLQDKRFDAQDKKLDEHTALLTQILARLSEKS